MANTLYIANPNALIPQSGRTVDTFPSGLVRVTQTYLGRTANAATHRSTLAVGNNMPGGDSSPCIDGLKIFPEVQERRQDDGMTEFIVSAYGRSNTTGSRAEVGTVKNISVYFNSWHITHTGGTSSTTGQQSFFYECLIGSASRRFVSPGLSGLTQIPAETVTPHSIKVRKNNSTEEVFIPYTVWENAVLNNGTQPSFTYNGQSLTIWNNLINALVGTSGTQNGLRFVSPVTKAGDTSAATIIGTEFTSYGHFNEMVVNYSSEFSVFFN